MHMVRHIWAEDRLWEGLIGPSDLAWRVGVAAFDETAITAHEMNEGQALPPEEAAMDEWIHQMAKFGGQMADAEARATYHTEVIASCSDCHVRMGKGPGNTTPVEE